MRVILLTVWVVASGCVFQDMPSIPVQTNFPDAGRNDAGLDAADDATLDATTDLGGDAALDFGLDATVDATPDAEIDAEIDAEVDAEVDAEPDVTPDPCLDELPLVNLPVGQFCPTVAPVTQTPACDVVTQTGCDAGQFCDIRFLVVNNVPVAQFSCVDGFGATNNTCEFIPVGEVCNQRASLNEPPVRLGTCFPGSACPGVFPTELETRCVAWCKLATGLGCATTEYCAPISSESQATGVGRCAPDTADCSN